MRHIVALAIAASSLAAQSPAPAHPRVLGPYSSTVNISLDLAGDPDSRPTTWGTSGSYASRIQFTAPTGYRTRVLRVYGDFIAFPKYPAAIAPGTLSEIGWGLKTTAPDGSQRVTYPGYASSAFDNSFVWVQGAVDDKQPAARIPVDFAVVAGGLLEPDNLLLSQAFVALNTTGASIHLEPTFTLVYQFELEKK